MHSSIDDYQQDLLGYLKGGHTAETNGSDTLKSVELNFGAYESVSREQLILC